MKLHKVKQKTPEWIQLRLDHPLTASQAQAIATGGKGLETLCWTKIAEKYSSAEPEDITNHHIDRGNELEEQARAMYELETGTIVKEVGFVTNDEYPLAGASPDGLIEGGGIEIKCFADPKHFRFILEEKIESQYIWQMQMQMLIGEYDFVDFVAFNPNYTQSLVVIRVEKDKEKQEKLKEGLKKGVEIINKIEKHVSKKI